MNNKTYLVVRRPDRLPVPGVHNLRAEALPPLGHLQQGLDLRVSRGLHDRPEHQEARPSANPGELHGFVPGGKGVSLQVSQKLHILWSAVTYQYLTMVYTII